MKKALDDLRSSSALEKSRGLRRRRFRVSDLLEFRGLGFSITLNPKIKGLMHQTPTRFVTALTILLSWALTLLGKRLYSQPYEGQKARRHKP